LTHIKLFIPSNIYKEEKNHGKALLKGTMTTMVACSSFLIKSKFTQNRISFRIIYMDIINVYIYIKGEEEI